MSGQGRPRVTWRKSSHSFRNGDCVEIALLDASWRKSSHCVKGADCVEVADLSGRRAAIRDSKRADGPVLAVGHAELRALVRAVGGSAPA